MPGEGDQKNGASSAGNRPAASGADALREQQAIAAAIMIGEEMRRSDRTHIYTLALRLGIFFVVMSFVGLVILFGLARISGDDFNPYPYMIVLGIVAGASGVAAYWGYAEARRHRH
jgi:H+/Cl- antiporter ClcA